MKFATVIGRVTLSRQDPSYTGARFMVGLPCGPQAVDLDQRPLPKGHSLVIYDNLGATLGDHIGYTDGGEAAASFPEPTPCDAYNAAILDRVYHTPPA